eukprot:g24165.t1
MQELEKRLQYKRNRTSAKCRARLLILEKLVLTILKGSFKNGLAHSTSDHLPKWPARTKKYSTGSRGVLKFGLKRKIGSNSYIYLVAMFACVILVLPVACSGRCSGRLLSVGKSLVADLPWSLRLLAWERDSCTWASSVALGATDDKPGSCPAPTLASVKTKRCSEPLGQ